MDSVEVEENAPINTIIKTLAIINKPRANFPMNCEIMSGNEEDKFLITENSNRDCEIRLKDSQLDYEHKSRYMLTVRIKTIAGLKGFSRLMTQVIINVIDVNDHKPIFHVPARYGHLTGNRYITGISSTAPSESQLIQLKATDSDSLSNGAITYQLLPSSEPEGRFKIDSTTGILRNSQPMEDIPSNQLPIKLTAIARDNPQSQSSSLSESVQIIINLIEDKHRIIFVLKDTPPERSQEMKEHFLQIVQEKTGLIPGWEKAESLKIQRNYSTDSDVTGTDVWLYLIDPPTLKIVNNDDPRVLSSLFEPRHQHSIVKAIVNLLGVRSVTIRRPFFNHNHHHHHHHPSTTANIIPIGNPINDLGIALIILAAIIAVIGFAGIMYQCGSNVNKKSSSISSSSIKKQSMDVQSKGKRVVLSPARPRVYEPIYTISDHHHSPPKMHKQPQQQQQSQLDQRQLIMSKEYETQVLAMDLKMDESDGLIVFNSDNRDKQSLRGLISVRNGGPESNISYIPRSRAFNNNSPNNGNHSTLTTTTINSSDKSSLKMDCSGSSTNSDLKSNIKNPLYGDVM